MKKLEYRKERLVRGIKARTDDIYGVSGFKEITYLLLPRALPVIGLAVLPVLVNDYWREVIISACVMALLALSWTLVTSVGLVSLGQALFVAFGGYIAGILNFYFHLPIYITIVVGTILGGALCTLLLMPVLRLKGIYFSMVTLVLPLVFSNIIEATHIFGGNNGLNSLSRFPNSSIMVYVAAVATLVCFFGFRKLIGTDYGLVFTSIGDNEQAVMSGGINIFARKAQCLFIGGSVGAFAGAFITHWIGFVGTPAFALDYSIIPIASGVVGGIGSYAGALLGAFIVVPLSEILRGIEGGVRTLFYSVALLIFIVSVPEGIFIYLERKYHEFERWVKVE